MTRSYRHLIALLAIVGVLGGLLFYTLRPVTGNIVLGLDISGGISVLLEAVPSAGSPTIDDDAMNRAVAVISNRVDGLGVAEPQIYREGSNRIRVALPNFGEEEGDQEKVRDILGQTALLEFRDAEGNVFLTGSSLRDAREQWDSSMGEAYVQLRFDDEGGKKMYDYTAANTNGFLFITLDGAIISQPGIREAVGSEGVINGIPSLEEARNLAIMLRSGALPVALEIRDFRAVGPTLGKVSLEQSVYAGMVGVTLVLLYMLLSYRLLGLLANVALILYVYLTLVLLNAIGATLTLPGIAGLILGVGMAVDANVIIFERIKEEAATGRTLRSAVQAGFRRAILTVLDSNITTLIAGGVLYYFGTGPVRGFAVTLSLGIVVSLFIAVFFTRWLLNLLVAANLTKSKAILGLGEVAK